MVRVRVRVRVGLRVGVRVEVAAVDELHDEIELIALLVVDDLAELNAVGMGDLLHQLDLPQHAGLRFGFG